MGGEADLLAGGENRLAVGRGNRAAIGDIRTKESDTATDVLRTRGALEPGTGLHCDVATFPVRRERGGGSKGGRAVRAGLDWERRKEKLLVGVVEQAASHQVVVERK